MNENPCIQQGYGWLTLWRSRYLHTNPYGLHVHLVARLDADTDGQLPYLRTGWLLQLVSRRGAML